MMAKNFIQAMCHQDISINKYYNNNTPLHAAGYWTGVLKWYFI